MFSFPTWPQFPSVSFPATLQRRFISFVLKRSLGHLVKPGQLDPAQIDAQIGSGFVQVTNVELDHDAINEHLASLPLPFALEAGSIGKISARIPWPNLTAPLALSLASLSLTLVYTPCQNSVARPSQAKDDLTGSVASMAESFFHDEISTRENEFLRSDLHAHSHSRRQPPGSMDPFLSTEDFDAELQTNVYDEVGDVDPSTQGVSIIATLIERLLSRFEFDASDINIRVVLPRKAEFALRIGQVTYSTDDKPDPRSPLSRLEVEDGEVRTAKVTGVSVSTCDLTPHTVPLTSASRRCSTPSLGSSSEEEDEEDIRMMSQSLASLPPTSPTRSISPESAMYQSAVSSIGNSCPEASPDQVPSRSREQIIISLGQGSEPIVLRLVTPRLVVPSSTKSSNDDTGPQSYQRSLDRIRLTVAIGPVAVALTPVHTRSLIYLSTILGATPPAGATSNPPKDRPADTLQVALHVKSITLLFLQTSRPPVPQSTVDETLYDFFHARSALVSSPRIPHLRIQFDGFEVSSTNLPLSADDSDHAATTVFTDLGATKCVSKASLADLSVFASTYTTDTGWTMSPVLISDTNLGSQYGRDVKFPSFDVIDWTKPKDLRSTGKVNQWRIRPLHSTRKSADVVSPVTSGSPKASCPPTVQVQLISGRTGDGAVCEVRMVPLHLFVDMGIMGGAVSFLAAATDAGFPPEEEIMPDLEETPPATPRARECAGWQIGGSDLERRRLENLLINDFSAHYADPRESITTGTRLDLCIALLRIEVRAPTTSTLSKPHSGAVIIDLHDLGFTQQNEVPSPGQYRRPTEHLSGRAGATVLGRLELRQLIIATAFPGGSRAAAFLSITNRISVSETQTSTFGISVPADSHLPLPSSNISPLPSICLRSNPVLPRHSTTASTDAAASLSLDANLPAVHMTLSKPVLDGLTFWADDITQCFYSDMEHASKSDTSGRSRDPSMIGSRFFAKRTASSASSESGGEGRKSELVIKMSIEDAQIRLLVPRKDEDGKTRPLDLKVLDVDLLAEVKPDNKDQTVVTVGIMDLNVCDTSSAGDVTTILGLTIPRGVVASSMPLVKLRYISVVDNDTAAKESRLKLSLSAFTYFLSPNITWYDDVALFVKAPEGAFESVLPSERTKVSLKITSGSFHIVDVNNPGALVAYIGELELSTDLVGDSQETVIAANLPSLCAFFIDDRSVETTASNANTNTHSSAEVWKQLGYALLAEAEDVTARLRHTSEPFVNTQVYIDSIKLKLHACADSIPAFGTYVDNIVSTFSGSENQPSHQRFAPTPLDSSHRHRRDVFAAVDEDAFRRAPDLGPAPDMIHDDLPTNLDYLDASFGAAAGLRELRDDDLFDYEPEFSRSAPTDTAVVEGVISNLRGETIRMLDPKGINVVEGHFDNIPRETTDIPSGSSDAKLSIRLKNCDLTVSLYEGYDWIRTRKAIEREVKAIRRRLVKIRQLLASGQTPDDSIEQTSAVLFNSVSIGLPQEPEELEPGALIAAIDEELKEDISELASQSSWQSFKPQSQRETQRFARLRVGKLQRSRGPQIDFSLSGIQAEIDQFHPNASLISRMFVTVKDLEILDYIKTSTWKKFLTELRTDFRGNIRETDSDMVRGELRVVHPVAGLPTEEGRFRAKVLPIRLHVDQDALDFMKKFFSFQDPALIKTSSASKSGLYFQHVEIYPVDLKLDYKPKRVDYRALREGKTIELMNFFHFDGAEITLRHITLSGITGWPRLFDTLNDLWTPDVKANQLADIISGVSPIRSLVNVGSGVADLVLLPIAQYKKDKRVIRGVQKGTTSFVKSTAMEAIKLGARLATGTQVILEQAETVLGGQGQFKDTVTAEALQTHAGSSDEESIADLISKYADQPQDVREGMQSAYKSLSKNFNSAAQTILAVPMEVYERSGNEGPVRAIVRAVPIAVIKPMIGASEAVSKTLFGLRNSMDPEVKHENEAKYKQR